jgi:hypothetical protein
MAQFPLLFGAAVPTPSISALVVVAVAAEVILNFTSIAND